MNNVLPFTVTSELSKFALRHAIPISIVRVGLDGLTKSIKNGTLSLISCKGNQFGFTNYHVYKEFIIGHDEFKTNLYLGPKNFTNRLKPISLSKENDLVSLDLNDIKESELSSEGDIPTTFFNAGSFSKVSVKKDDWLVLGGYPGAFREYMGNHEYSYFSFSYGGCKVNHSTEDRIYSEFNIDSCIQFGRRANHDVPDLGGLSGCPAFVLRENELGFLYHEFAGVFYEFGDMLQIAKLKPASLISDEGIIVNA